MEKLREAKKKFMESSKKRWGQIEDNLIKDSSIMLASTVVCNICFLLFHVYMSRSLGPGSYGIIVSFLSISFIVSLPATAIQTVVAKYASNFKVSNQFGKINFLFLASLKKVGLYGLVGLGIFSLASGYVRLFLHIPSKLPVLILGVALFLSLIVPVARGILQGLQRFGYLGMNLSTEAIFRLVFGFFLVYMGMRVLGATGGIALGFVMAFLVAFLPLKSFLRKRSESEVKINFREIYGYFRPVSLALLCFAILTNVDVIFVKHFFSPLEAGYYSVLAVIGRALLSVAIAFSMAMFPKVSELHTRQKDSSSTLRKSLFICFLACGVGILICFTLPDFIIFTIFGQEYLPISPLLRIFPIAITPLALSYTLIHYNLARHSTGFLYSLVFGAGLYVVMLALFHSSLREIVLVLGGVGYLVLVMNLASVFFPFGKTVKERAALRS